MTPTKRIPDRIIELKLILNELENSELCMEHENPDIREMADDSIMNMRESLEDFITVFNKSL